MTARLLVQGQQRAQHAAQASPARGRVGTAGGACVARGVKDEQREMYTDGLTEDDWLFIVDGDEVWYEDEMWRHSLPRQTSQGLRQATRPPKHTKRRTPN